MLNDFKREWELDGAKHRTRDDARAQINKSKMGSSVAASYDYMCALRSELANWINEIDAELTAHDSACRQSAEPDGEPPCDCGGAGPNGIHEDHCATVVY